VIQPDIGAFTLMSYNLWKNQAVADLDGLIARHPVDILCVQEANTATLPRTLGDLRLSASTDNDRLGLAIYTRDGRFSVRQTRSFALTRSIHDRLMGSTPERLVGANLVDEATGDDLVVASFHAAPLSDPNVVRRAQIRRAHHLLTKLGGGLPTIMIGDFNYPWFARHLAECMAKAGYTLSRGAASTYHRFPILRGTFDLATSIGYDLGPIRTLAQGLSDHLPIVVTATRANRNHAIEPAVTPETTVLRYTVESSA
jgi:exodeoxyribonuclease-3